MRFSRLFPAVVLALSLALEPAAAAPFIGASTQPMASADNAVIQVQQVLDVGTLGQERQPGEWVPRKERHERAGVAGERVEGGEGQGQQARGHVEVRVHFDDETRIARICTNRIQSRSGQQGSIRDN